MSDFGVFFPSKECHRLPASFFKLDGLFRDPLGADDVQPRLVHGAPVLLSTAFDHTPHFYAKPDGSGWIVIKGTICVVYSETPVVDLERLLDQFLTQAPGDLNRYEGTFALAAWDARKAQGWALNDQASTLNLYYGEHDGGLYVTTHALSLARVLGLKLDPCSVLEFLLRSVLLAPASMFAGLKRIDVGEHIRYRAGMLFGDKHWSVFQPRAHYRDIGVAAEEAASLAVDRVSRYGAIASASASPVLCDLTGGLDSRLMTSAIYAAGLNFAVTVNGQPDSEDVGIARKIGETLGWSIRHFDPRSLWTLEVTPDIRRELVYRTNGELCFPQIYHHLLTRPVLSKDFVLHMIGTGSELARTYTWEEAWTLAHMDTTPGAAPPGLLSINGTHSCRSRLRAKRDTVYDRQSGAWLTQQWDAAFIWLMTSHSSLYLSSVHNWLPSVAPMMSAGFAKAVIAMPWTMRIGSRLQRRIICQLAPRVSQVESWDSSMREYRGTAELGLKTMARETQRYASRVARIVGRKLLKGYLSRRASRQSPTTKVAPVYVPFLTPEFRRFLDPATMFSRALYTDDGLLRALSGDDAEWCEKAMLLANLGSVEQLCRELEFRPDPDFLAPALADGRVV